MQWHSGNACFPIKLFFGVPAAHPNHFKLCLHSVNYALELLDRDPQESFIKALHAQTLDKSPCIAVGMNHMEFLTCPHPKLTVHKYATE